VRVLVTGGAGFIGSHLVDALLERGHAVTVVDRADPVHAARGADYLRADVTDMPRMLDAFAQARPDVAYHLAAQIDVRRSVDDPAHDAHANIGGTAAVLEAARRAGARRVLLASTAGVYGDPAELPISEGAPVAPLSPYGASKAAAESYMALFSRLYGLSTLALRMSNVYGPRQSPEGEAGVVAIFCAAAGDGRPVTIYGDGGQTRDFLFVADAVEAFIAAGETDLRGVANVSSGVETSVAGLAAALGVATRPGPERLGEVRRSSLDPSLAAQQLGWTARTPLQAGLQRTLAALAPAVS
jgi:UDP-glucose 4-epimerase